jgi:hypothetical protein
MNRTQLEHIIRAASRISGDDEIVVIGSQSIHAQEMSLPPITYISEEADVYPRHYPERADDIDIAIGELSSFHENFGYSAHGVSPKTAILPAGWEQRLVRLWTPNTGGAVGLCLDPHDLILSKYAAGREKDLEFNRALADHGCIQMDKALRLAEALPVDAELKEIILRRIKADFVDPPSAVTPHSSGP